MPAMVRRREICLVAERQAFSSLGHLGWIITVCRHRICAPPAYFGSPSDYWAARRETTSAKPRTIAYVANRYAAYLPPDSACSLGMNVAR
jgi:hypothetical protein